MGTRLRYGLRLGAALLAAILSALPAVHALDTSVSVGNAAPTVLGLTLEGTVLPTAGGATSVPISVRASDGNGQADLATARIALVSPSGAAGPAADLPRLTGSGTQATFGGSFPMAYHLEPGTWTARVTVTDTGGASATMDATFQFARMAAVGLTPSALSFGGTLLPGQLSPVATLTLQNLGNVEMDLLYVATPLANATTHAVISERNVRWGLDSSMQVYSALSAETSVDDFNLAAGAQRDVHWQVLIPSGSEQWIPAGVYRGSLAVAAKDGGI